MPVVHLASTFTEAKEGKCISSVINTLDEEKHSSSLLRLEYLNKEEKGSISGLCNEYACKEYADIFHLPGDKLTCTTAVDHNIPIEDARQ
ncbi:hypothetical protein PR048_018414 [Dryococelus australis]|uniref:Uncharacterized protein n=1 Tax=Dryococelus australis TaxID=614101 RepID=A0ABQ9HC94_9NEOP|nr:hypothetical protein PR048_018414 [Dryococelus australis]